MLKFQAPEHVHGIHTSVGSHYEADEKGIIEVPDDAPDADLTSLAIAGWTRIADEPAAVAPPSKPAPAKPETLPPAE